jgi:Domain of unknown function (DUF6883)
VPVREPALKDAFDEWLARVVCYAFSVSPQAFVHQLNRATGETQKELAEEEGLWPILKWVKRLIDRVLVEDFGEEEIEFAWGEDAQIDASQQAQILTSYVAAGILTRNEARAQLGQTPVEDDAANALLVTTGSGPASLPKLTETGATPGKFNQYHDDKGQFTTSSGAHIVSPAPDMRNHDLKPKGDQVAQAETAAAAGIAAVTAASAASAYRAYQNWANSPPSAQDAPAPLFPSSPSEDPENKRPPAAVEQPNAPITTASPDPGEPEKGDEQNEQEAPRDNSGRSAKGALPNAENAIIDSKKLVDYALDPEHVTGSDKARVFNSALGFDQSNAENLAAQIREGVLRNPAVEGSSDQYGKRFNVDIPVTGPNGSTKTVRTGWIFDPGATRARLVTIFVRQ